MWPRGAGGPGAASARLAPGPRVAQAGAARPALGGVPAAAAGARPGRHAAERQRDIAASRQLAANSGEVAASDPGLSLAPARRAVETAPTAPAPPAPRPA